MIVRFDRVRGDRETLGDVRERAGRSGNSMKIHLNPKVVRGVQFFGHFALFSHLLGRKSAPCAWDKGVLKGGLRGKNGPKRR